MLNLFCLAMTIRMAYSLLVNSRGSGFNISWGRLDKFLVPLFGKLIINTVLQKQITFIFSRTNDSLWNLAGTTCKHL